METLPLRRSLGVEQDVAADADGVNDTLDCAEAFAA